MWFKQLSAFKKKHIQKYLKSHIRLEKNLNLFLIQKFPSQKKTPHLIVECFCCGAATPGHQGLRNTAVLDGFCHQVLLTTTHFTQQNHPQWPVGVLLKFWDLKCCKKVRKYTAAIENPLITDGCYSDFKRGLLYSLLCSLTGGINCHEMMGWNW